MKAEHCNVGMESVIDLFWNTEEITASGNSDNNPADPGAVGGNDPFVPVPCRCTPRPGPIVRLFSPNFTCFG